MANFCQGTSGPQTPVRSALIHQPSCLRTNFPSRLMAIFPYSRLFVGPSFTVAISGPHIQVIDNQYVWLFLQGSEQLNGLRTGDIHKSTADFGEQDREALLKSGPVRCAAIDNSGRHLATSGEDKILKIWEVDGLKLLNERYVIAEL